jgi:hypothetical protein
MMHVAGNAQMMDSDVEDVCAKCTALTALDVRAPIP